MIADEKVGSIELRSLLSAHFLFVERVEMDNTTASHILKVAQAELRSLPPGRKVFQKRAGVFFLSEKSSVLQATTLKEQESKK